MNGFRRGSGCFNCSECGRQTRHTGAQAMNSDLCPICWDVAGLENEQQDSEDDAAHDALQVEIDELNNLCVSKGGVLCGYPKAL